MTGWLHKQRLSAVSTAIQDRGARTLIDLGCGDGDLLVSMLSRRTINRVVGVDLCEKALRRLQKRLEERGIDKGVVELLQISMLDLPRRLQGVDCAVLVEAIEHLETCRLGTLEQSLFGRLRPSSVIVTTPNAEFNALLGVPSHRFRHRDHCFEWDRSRFRRWATRLAQRQSYAVECRDIAGMHPRLGGASQMAVFDVLTPVNDTAQFEVNR